MVTSFAENLRTWRIRSTSSGVVIEPSTIDTSYGPSTVARVASRKYAISTPSGERAAARPRSRACESWQPSHDANFQTASFGLRSDRHQSSRTPNAAFRLRPAENRAVAAYERRTPLAVAAVADAQRMLRSIESAMRLAAQTPRVEQGLDREAHHHLGTADHRHARVAGSNSARAISAGTTPTLPRHPAPAASTVSPTSSSRARAIARAPSA